MASTAEQIAFETGWNLHIPLFKSSKRQFEPWGPSTSLGAMSMQATQELDSIMFVKDHEAGDILFMEREPLKRVFVVISGDVRLSMQDLCGRRLTFQVARRGSVLGMETVLFGSVCEWSADTLHSSRIGTIGWEEFVRFAERHPEVYRFASRQLIQTVEAACSTLRIIGLNSCIRKRLALQLLDWGQRGSTNGDQTQFRMALTHEQIAEFVGAARESITRALITFRQLGLIEIRGSMVRIPSTTALRNYAERV